MWFAAIVAVIEIAQAIYCFAVNTLVAVAAAVAVAVAVVLQIAAIAVICKQANRTEWEKIPN